LFIYYLKDVSKYERPVKSTSAQALNLALKPTALGFTLHNRVIHKVRKTQHQNPEFGQHRVKRYIGIQGGVILICMVTY
jgi:hypothetical protein